jgi:hypothetical protein
MKRVARITIAGSDLDLREIVWEPIDCEAIDRRQFHTRRSICSGFESKMRQAALNRPIGLSATAGSKTSIPFTICELTC